MIEKELGRLKTESFQLRQLVREYSEGLTVNETSVDKRGNSLLIVNGGLGPLQLLRGDIPVVVGARGVYSTRPRQFGTSGL